MVYGLGGSRLSAGRGSELPLHPPPPRTTCGLSSLGATCLLCVCLRGEGGVCPLQLGGAADVLSTLMRAQAVCS